MNRLSFYQILAAIVLTGSFAQGGDPYPFSGPEGGTLYGANGDSPATVFTVDDPTTGTISNDNLATIFESSYPPEIFSLATQPGTNAIHCVYRANLSMSTPPSLPYRMPLSLGIVDPDTGVITPIADFTYETEPIYDGIPGITFDCDGNLYAVTASLYPDEFITRPPGDDGGRMTGAGLIFRVNPTTAELIEMIAEGTEGDGHNLEFNPQDGLLYHFFTGKGPAFETVDPGSGALSPLTPLSGYYTIQAIVYAGDGQFLGHQVGRDTFYVITSAGSVFPIGPSPSPPNDKIRGLAYDTAVECSRFQPDLLIGKRHSNVRENNFYTETGRRQTIRGLRMPGRVGSSITIPLVIQNDGAARDRIRLRWRFENLETTGNRVGNGPRFRRQIFLLLPRGRTRNVTALARTRGFQLDPGESRRIIFKLTVRRRPARNNSSLISSFRAISLSDDSKVDVGKAHVTVRKSR